MASLEKIFLSFHSIPTDDVPQQFQLPEPATVPTPPNGPNNHPHRCTPILGLQDTNTHPYHHWSIVNPNQYIVQQQALGPQAHTPPWGKGSPPMQHYHGSPYGVGPSPIYIREWPNNINISINLLDPKSQSRQQRARVL